jgi:glucose/arabinose dehydrogenase
MSKFYRFFGLALGIGSLAALLAVGCDGDRDGSSSSNTGQGGSPAGGAGGTGPGGGGSGGSNLLEVNCEAPTGAPGALTLTEIASGLGLAVEAAVPFGDNERLFVGELEGRVHLLKNGNVSLFLDITDRVLAGGERGLLGLTFHPDYVNNGRFFVHYSGNNDGETVIEEYARSADPDVASPEPVGSPILVVPQPAPNHNGGAIHFNPLDGLLYIGLGDGGGSCDSYDNGQDTGSPLGALLRIDVDTTPYSIPPGNLDGAGAPEIYDYGLRNPYRWTFDACTGDRYIGDVGQDQYEEVDVAAFNDGNKNWGWPVFEGSQCPALGCGGDERDCRMPGYTPPAIAYQHFAMGHSVVGGYVYRGSAIPWLRGAYFYAEFYTGQVWMFRWDNGTATGNTEITEDLGGSVGQLAAFAQDNQGEIYIVAYDGTVYRIDPG